MRATYIQNQKEVIRATRDNYIDNVTSNNNGVYSSDVTQSLELEFISDKHKTFV